MIHAAGMVKRISRITRRSVDAIKPDGTDTVYWDGELTGFGMYDCTSLI